MGYDGEWEHRLVSDFDVSPDALPYTIRLQEGAKWHAGAQSQGDWGDQRRRMCRPVECENPLGAEPLAWPTSAKCVWNSPAKVSSDSRRLTDQASRAAISPVPHLVTFGPYPLTGCKHAASLLSHGQSFNHLYPSPYKRPTSLRGTQVMDAEGMVEFEMICPGWHPVSVTALN